MNAAEGLWPEPLEETLSSEHAVSSAPGDDTAEAGMGFFFAPEGLEAEASSSSSGDDASSEGHADGDAPVRRPSYHRLSVRPGARRPAQRGRVRTTHTAVSKLARAVDSLRELETEMSATLGSADRTLRAVGGREIYEGAGFASYAELEQRLVCAVPVLQGIRTATRSGTTTTTTGAGTQRLWKRSTRALASISRALHRLRALDDQLLAQASRARQALADIERGRLYEECGYTSFEDFLERALGPSPLLSCAVTLVEGSPERVHTPPPPLPEEVADDGSFARVQTAEIAVSSEMVWPAPDPEGEPVPAPRKSRLSVLEQQATIPASQAATLIEAMAAEPTKEAAAPPPPLATAPARSRWVAHAILTVVLALVATGIGVVSARAGLHRVPTAVGPDASVQGEPAKTASPALASATPSAATSAAQASSERREPRKALPSPWAREAVPARPSSRAPEGRRPAP
jgi:hypothetical protein